MVKHPLAEKHSRIVFQSCLLIEPPLYETKTLPPKTARKKEINGGGDHIAL
jgi:hypothetical protein